MSNQNLDLFSPSIPSVTQLTAKIKLLLEQNFTDVMVEGEISNAKTSRNGHTYFTIKDEGAQLPCVVWRNISQRENIEIVDGQHIIAGGDIEVYPPHGKYQLIVHFVQQAGLGALQKAYEELKKKLKEEGLFDEAHKKSLPEFPMTIGVITSATGAAFHDISSTLARRWPLAKILLYHASVQGSNAAPEIVKGIEYFSEQENADVLIVGRGGGSLEDLWPFNEEAVARALYACRVPTISAVGHEVDFSISDFVADARAATPTQAAVIAAPDANELRFFIEDMDRKIVSITEEKINRTSDLVQQLLKTHALMAVKEKVENRIEKCQNLTNRLNHRQELLLLQQKEKFHSLSYQLENLNPNAPLERGYVRVYQNDEWTKNASDFDKEETFSLEWKDGRVEF